MPDPFEQLQALAFPADGEPDPAFTARLRARLERALSLPEGVTVSALTRDLAPAAHPAARASARTGVLTPYLAVRNARRAIDWYRDVLGARLRSEPVVMPDGRIGHAELALGDAHLMLAEEHPEIGHVAPSGSGTPVSLHLDVDDVDDVDRLSAAAVAAGAELTRPPGDFEYGRVATFVDPFGHRWQLVAASHDAVPDDAAGLRHGDLGYVSLWVPDAGRAAAFFGAVLGWSLDGDMVARHAPSHGLRGGVDPATLFACFAVDDLDAAVEAVRLAGGDAGEPVSRSYGRVSDCRDDQGMPFALWQLVPGAARAGAGGWRQGDLTYVTLEVADSARFRAFFSAVLGWRFLPGQVDDGWQVPDVAPMCGIHGGHDRARAVPMYVVDDIAGAVARVRAAGGTADDPERQPYGVSAHCTDDQATPFYLIEY